MHNSGGTATDIDVYFYGADCTTFTGSIATGAAEENGLIPAGTRWAQFVLFAGTTDGFEAKAISTLEPVKGPTKVAFRRVTNPRPDLPATGVGSAFGFALMLLGGALLLRRLMGLVVTGEARLLFFRSATPGASLVSGANLSLWLVLLEWTAMKRQLLARGPPLGAKSSWRLRAARGGLLGDRRRKNGIVR